MRRITLILIALLGLLLLEAGASAPFFGLKSSCSQVLCVADEAPCQGAIAPSSGREWFCEQRCNSDLNLPRTLSNVAVPQGTALSLRRTSSDFEREHDAVNQVYVRIALSRQIAFYNHRLSAGLQAVDQYVYRLRRLII